MVTAYSRGDLGGVANTAMGLLKRVAKGDSAQSKALKTKTSPADVIMWSGSKDTQTSYVYFLPLKCSAFAFENLLPVSSCLCLLVPFVAFSSKYHRLNWRSSISNKSRKNRQDAQIGGEATGAMSWAFITALKKNPQQSYVQLLNSIRNELSTKYSQKPQLSSSHPLSKYRI